MTDQINGGQFIARSLQAHGVTHVFFMDAILRRALLEMERLGIRRILTHSEKAAAYMADGYARTSGRPGVCMAQSVGAANLAAGLQDAYFADSSVIALTGRHTAALQYRNAYQELPHQPLFDSVTKNSMRVDVPEQLPRLIRQAFREATTGRSGPVHVDIAGHTGDVIGSCAVEQDLHFGGAPFNTFPALRTAPDEGHLRQALHRIEAASRPVIVADQGAMVSRAGGPLVRLAEQLSIPIVCSLDAKALLPEEHPLNAGIVGTYSRTCANRTVFACDLAIFVGSRVSDQVTNQWTLPHADVDVIHIDVDPAELGRNHPRTFGLPGDPQLILEKLLTMAQPARRGAWLEQVRGYVQEWRQEARAQRDCDDIPVRPERLCKALSEALPDDAILVADTGYSSQWSGTLVDLNSPRQRYLRAAGSLGWGFPAAIGAKCAAPDQPVVCFCGDGAFWYHLAELETARRYGIRVVTVVNNNSCLAQGLRAINDVYRGQSGNPGEIHDFRPTNFARIAESLDCLGLRVERPADFQQAMQKALAADVPAVIDVVTDPSAVAPLAWSPN